MKIVLIGATGYTGSAILKEALDRDHAVTAIVRKVDRLPAHPQLAARAADVTDTQALAALLTGHEVVISAFNPGKDDTGRGAASITQAVQRAAAPRLVVIGGAGSLEVAPGQRLLDSPDFPAQWKDGALKTAAFLDLLRNERVLAWSFVSPAAELVPGTRTGRYRVGGDRLLTDAAGASRISTQDLAVAVLDEVEQPRHPKQRFSVAW